MITALSNLFLLFSSPTHASLINPNYISAAAGIGSQSTQFSGDRQESIINTYYNPSAPTNILAYNRGIQSHTGIGFARGSGELNYRYGIMKIYNEFRINDLVLTYNGNGVAQQTVRGATHISHASSLTHGAKNGNSMFNMAATVNSQSRSHRLAGIAINSSGVWEEWFNFYLGAKFNLKFNAEMLIPTEYINQNGAVKWLAKASFATILGGSPVFNLPEGYTINSADGSIVNNYFVGNQVSAIPEPNTIILLFIAIIGLCILNSKQRHMV